MIDTHCHLADKKFSPDLEPVLERAQRAGVDRVVTISDSVEESRRCVQIAEKYPEVFCAVGVHPHASKEWKSEGLDELRSMVQQSKKVKAIGEIGLDYHYDFSPREMQKRAFEDQLKLAKEINISAVVHNRESIEDLYAIIDRVAPPKLVLHCCTEKWEDVRPLVERGYLLSFTGIATYDFATVIRDTIQHCPLEQMMVETDAPYLAPGLLRGKRNEPAYVVEVAKLIATIKGVPLEEVERVTTKNAVEFFRF